MCFNIKASNPISKLSCMIYLIVLLEKNLIMLIDFLQIYHVPSCHLAHAVLCISEHRRVTIENKKTHCVAQISAVIFLDQVTNQITEVIKISAVI